MSAVFLSMVKKNVLIFLKKKSQKKKERVVNELSFSICENSWIESGLDGAFGIFRWIRCLTGHSKPVFPQGK